MSSRRLSKRRSYSLLLSGLAVMALALLFGMISGSSRSSAAPALPALQSTPLPVQMSISNETCLGCHSNPNLSMSLGDGSVAGLHVPEELYQTSVHGELRYACVQCHTTVGNYPHPPFNAQDTRDITIQLNESCKRCHSQQALLARDSVHAIAMQAGNRNAALCVDCHSAHTTQRLTDPATGKLTAAARKWVPQTCAKCHYAIYQKYTTSVHGSALLDEGNTDVPTCIDCHGVHNIEDPTTTQFRLKSPDLCADCHTDAQLMAKYGLSTDVLRTYVADFHGTTVTLFEKQHPDQETNKPVCYDCHGIHDIKSVKDPVSGIHIKENLLIRCQACHPDANINFPDAWMSHYIPTADRHPLIFTVNMFYLIMIPTVLGGMAILVGLDVSKQVRKRFGKKRSGKVGVFPTSPPPTAPAQEKPGWVGFDPEVKDAGQAGNPAAKADPSQPNKPDPNNPDSPQEVKNG